MNDDATNRGSAGVLIIGYGNPLRTDDGVGWYAAIRLARDPRLAGAEVLPRFQLTPELAEDVSWASLVVLVDARYDPRAPGTITIRRIDPVTRPLAAWSHHLDPAALVALTDKLYGGAPPVVLVSVGAASFDDGEGLSPALRGAVPQAVETVTRIVREHTGARDLTGRRAG